MAKKHSKRYNAAVKVADLAKDYALKDAVEILVKFPKAKFDETVELSFNLGVDATSGEQNVRGTTPLPNGSGKKVRVIVFTDDAQKAIAAGADEAGLADLMKKVSDGWLDFDVAIATTKPNTFKGGQFIKSVTISSSMSPSVKVSSTEFSKY
jgi:large subunit ribosomal protein L1